MTVALKSEDEAIVRRLVEAGRFAAADDVIHAALQRLEIRSPLETAEIWPAGFLAGLYAEEEDDEIRFAHACSTKIEEP
jgi:Arc/MetJ-type ribon-helix-helix transcriptional regulator